jgi:hypothetical protein
MDTGHVHVAEYLKVPVHVYFTMLGHIYAFKPIYPILSLDKVLWFAMQRFRV